MAAEEQLLNLFDSYWFEHAIFSSKSLSQPQEIIQTNPSLQIPEEIQEPEFSRLPTIHVRSLSEQLLDTKTSFLSDSFSPNSVLNTSKLQTILSGKEVEEFSEENSAKKEEVVEEIPMKKKTCSERIIRRRKKGSSKSLSDLEFEELKGFMDLGFVFTEEDNKDSELVSIIPGLQRLGKKEEENNKEKDKKKKKKNINGADYDDHDHVASRPYLSEAWDVLDYQRKKEKPLMMMNWRIPALGNEIDMKDHLRFWAHSVASTVLRKMFMAWSMILPPLKEPTWKTVRKLGVPANKP